MQNTKNLVILYPSSIYDITVFGEYQAGYFSTYASGKI